jgi:pSer/pThr/pTyr-binding forkhead associated (FHA) protein
MGGHLCCSIIHLASKAYVGDDLRPIARLLVSTSCDTKLVDSIPKPNREITSVKDISIPTIIEPEDRSKIIKINRNRRRKPVTAATVERRFFRRISFSSNWAQVWKTRNSVHALGAVTTSGRSPENDIVLADVQVSRQHAVIRYERSGYVLYDFTITNPIKVNDEEIAVYKTLTNGDVIEIGTFLAEFQQANLPTVDKTGSPTKVIA